MFRQRTVREKTCTSGVGLHSGQWIRIEILPAPEDSGITFVRTDLKPHVEVPACLEHVADTALATTLAMGVNGSRASVGTVEHLLAAFAGLGIDNARVLLDGPEVPIMDGSSGPLVGALLEAGIEPQRRNKRFLVIKREVKVVDGDRVAKLSPGSGLRVTCTLDFDHPLIPGTPFCFTFSERGFQRELARARTFGFLRDVESLQARGLARGGSLENAIVIDRYRVMNPEGLRFQDEFVRHKVLDAVGDLALLGMPLVGRVTLHRPGHALNTRLIQALLDDPKAYEVVRPSTQTGKHASADEERPFRLFDAVETLA